MVCTVISCALCSFHSAYCQTNQIKYLCSPCNAACDSIRFSKPGICPHCKMKLIIDTQRKPSSVGKINGSKLDSFINILNNKGLALGGLAISKNGEVQYQRAIGYSYINNNIHANIKTRYRIGSVSKLFTAVMIFELIEKNKLKLDEKIAVYYPNLPNADKITIRHLLYHRSGLHDYTVNTNFTEWMDKPKTHEDLLNIVKHNGSDFTPGTKASYSSTNYLLLGYIIEKVSKMSYQDAFQKRIVTKIGLRDTYYGQPITASKNEGVSYKYADGAWKEQKKTSPSIHGGAGSIVSTPTDLVKFINNLFAYKFIGEASLKQMTTLIDEYGMGLFANKYGSYPSFGHNGRIEEFYTALWYYPSEKLAIAYCTNGINYPRSDLVENVLKICFNEPFNLPFSTLTLLSPNNLDQYLGNYSSSQMPMIITCKKADTQLVFETKGKSLKLDPIGRNYFMDMVNGYFFRFDPEEGGLEVKETDNVYYFKRTK